MLALFAALALPVAILIAVKRRSISATTVLASLIALQLLGLRTTADSEQSVSLAVIFSAGVAFLVAPALATRPRRLLRAWSSCDAGLWVAFLALGLIGLTWSADPEYGLHKLVLFAAYGVAPGLAASIIHQRNPTLRWLDVVAVGVVYCLATLTYGTADSGRLATAGSNPIWVGRTAALTLMVSALAGGWPKAVKYGCVALATVVLLLANSRGPALAAVLAPTLVYATRRVRDQKVKWVPAIVYSSGIGAAIVLFALLGESDLLPDVTLPRAASLLQPAQLRTDENVADRVQRQTEALTQFMSAPMLGIGLGAPGAPGERRYPHNVLLEIAAEMGLAGIGIFALLVIRSVRGAAGSFLLQVLLLMVVMFALTSGDLGFNNYIPLLAMIGRASGSDGRSRQRDSLSKRREQDELQAESSRPLPGAL